MRLVIVLLAIAVSGSAHADKPQIVVAVASAHDVSTETEDAATRATNRETIREALLAAVEASPDQSTVARPGLPARSVDPLQRENRNVFRRESGCTHQSLPVTSAAK